MRGLESLRNMQEQGWEWESKWDEEQERVREERGG